ncbi:MAG: hypothetical protein Q7R95_04850, partial [bacterium]|nr:hypothetical protein [bacterium]
NIDGFNGFCLENKYCFVNFLDKFKFDNLVPNVLYLISHDKSVGGDWDWRKNPPAGIKVQETVTNYYNQPIFYLVTKSEK